jgi:hypothetical protein
MIRWLALRVRFEAHQEARILRRSAMPLLLRYGLVCSGDPGQHAAAIDKAAEALAKAQNISVDQAKAQIAQYQQQYKDMVAKTKQQAKEAADGTAKAVSRGALFGALALLLGALAAFFSGQAGAVVPTVSSPRATR